ncbi:MAG: hypothetical protein ACOC5E_02435, partial [Acidobacteriota bacterium]
MILQLPPLPGVGVAAGTAPGVIEEGGDFLEGVVSGAGDVLDHINPFGGGSPNNQGERSECESSVMSCQDNPSCAGTGGSVTGLRTLADEIKRAARSSPELMEALRRFTSGQLGPLEFQGQPPQTLDEAACYTAWAIKNADAGGRGAVTSALRESNIEELLEDADTGTG